MTTTPPRRMPGWGGTLTAVYDQAQYGLTKLRQLWRVMYLGNGYYSIRPMHKLDMAMTLSGGNVAANPTTTTDTLSALASSYHWTITWGTGGYAVKYTGSNGLAMRPAEGTVAAGLGVVVGGYGSTSTLCHWTLELFTGVLLYKKSVMMPYTSAPGKVIAVGESKTLSAMDLMAISSGRANNSQTLSWVSSNTAVATVSSTGTVTGVSTGTAIITGRFYLNGTYYAFRFAVCIGYPDLFGYLFDLNALPYYTCDATGDGLFITTTPLSAILLKRNITSLPDEDNQNGERPVSAYYDDWYLYAIEDGGNWRYGLFKMREQESDKPTEESNADGDDPGVTISFVAFYEDALTACLNSAIDANRSNLLVALNKATGPEVYAHDDVLAGYFRKTESTGAYLIAEKYVSFIASLAVNGEIALPQNCINVFEKLESVREQLNDPFLTDNNVRLVLSRLYEQYIRIPNALNRINTDAGYAIYNNVDQTLSINDATNLTVCEKQAILTCFTANETFNSFAAEVEFHADALYSWENNVGNQWYKAALRADMAIGEEVESGFYDDYYDLESDIVQSQAAEHGEY